MPRTTFLIVDQQGQQLGKLKALRDTWTPGEQLVVGGARFRVRAVVTLDGADASEPASVLVVEQESALEEDVRQLSARPLGDNPTANARPTGG
jgi:hypothetical protein